MNAKSILVCGTACVFSMVVGMHQTPHTVSAPSTHVTPLTDTLGCTLLHYEENPAIALALLGSGMNINHQNKLGYTALHWAIQRNNEKIVIVLLTMGADPNIANVFGWTPLHCACFWGLPPIVASLLTHGATWDAKTMQGQTPADLTRNMQGIRNQIPKEACEEILQYLQDAMHKHQHKQSFRLSVFSKK